MDRDPQESEEPQVSEPVVQSKPSLVPTPAAAAAPPPKPSWVMVTFNVHAKTVTGETIHLTGTLSELKKWKPETAISLDCSQSYPMWTTTVKLPGSTTFKYKYIRKWYGPADPVQWWLNLFGLHVAHHLQWESDPNRSFTTPPSGSCTISDIWR